MKKISSGITLVLLISMLLLSGSSHSTESTSLAGVEKAINFLVHIQFNQSLGLCRESHLAPNVYWLVSDNLWTWKALKVANETYYFGAGEVGQVADGIKAKLKEDATLYNLPRDLNGFPISFMHEAVIGDVIPTPNRTTTILTLHSDDYIVKTEICNGTTMPDWYEYADRLLYKALSCHWEGNDTAANLYFKNATETWDGIGISDNATKADGLYATYKLALLLYTSKVLGRKLPFEFELVKRIWSLQRESDGGIITNYYANGTQKGDANTETTSIVIIALLTPPRARLGTFAFYYPWYGTPDFSGNWSHWNEDNSPGQIPHDPNTILTNGRRDIAAEDYPLLGVYDSNNESVIEQHVKWAKEAGIDCFIVSWWGINHFTDNASKHIRDVCERDDFKFTFYYENSTSISQTEKDIEYILNNYASSSAYYNIDGRPVIFVYKRTRDALNPNAWNLYFNGVNQPVSSAGYWRLFEDVRSPPRYGIFAIEPHENGIGYIENKDPITLSANETYTLDIGISDIRNDFDPWSDVGFEISISNGTSTTTFYNQTVNFNQGWLDLSFDVSSYADSNVTMRAESFDDRNNNTWNSEWAAVDYFYVCNSSGKPVNPDSYFDNGWKTVINDLRKRGLTPYMIMDFGGHNREDHTYEEKVDDFVEYFKNCIDGIHLYSPIDYSEDPSRVLDVYNIASESAYSRNMTFVATVMPGFNNTAVQNESRVIDRREGSYYDLYWLVAKACSPDGYAITSFNEWHEGTEIEPSREYGYQYISLTRHNIPEFPFAVLSLFMIMSLSVLFTRKRLMRKHE
jgi:hypothetical protein